MRAGDSMASVWIFHEPELFVEFDQFVEQALRALKVNIVVACAMDDEEFALQAGGECDR